MSIGSIATCNFEGYLRVYPDKGALQRYGGGTFKGIAQLLGFHYPDRERTIHVTHMVNPKGITTLSENYKEVYFTNSYKDWNKETLPDNVKVIEIV